jgi:hypothetical protein
MLIRTGFDIAFETEVAVPMLALLNVRPERQKDLRTPEVLATEPFARSRQYTDSFGNLYGRTADQPPRHRQPGDPQGLPAGAARANSCPSGMREFAYEDGPLPIGEGRRSASPTSSR